MKFVDGCAVSELRHVLFLSLIEFYCVIKTIYNSGLKYLKTTGHQDNIGACQPLSGHSTEDERFFRDLDFEG
jgi:hypothetical protein